MSDRRASVPPEALRATDALPPPTGVIGAGQPDSGAAGDLFGGRYRLTRLVHRGRTEVWQAEDEILARSVAVRLLGLASAASRADFLAAAGQSGRYPGPGVASVFDASTATLAGRDVTFVVSAWVEGQPLDERLADTPMDVAEATRVVSALSDTLSHTHQAGVFARRLHPGHVVLTPAADPVVVDLEVTAVVHEDLPARSHGDLVLADTRDLARVLYACVTGCWPAGGTTYSGLPAAPHREGRLCLPRQVRAGLPKALDLLIARTLEPSRRPNDPPIQTPEELRGALARLDAPVTGPVKVDDVNAPATRNGRLARLLLILLVLAGIGTGGWILGLVVGRVPGSATSAPKVPGLHASPAASGGASDASDPLTLAAVNSFDPQADKTENESQVAFATDGDPSTAWTTESYATLNFGGYSKTGVGLLVDLGSAKAVSRVVLTAPAGQTVEVLAAPAAASAPTTVDDSTTPVVGGPVKTSSGGDTTITVAPGTSSRWYVVWITGLAPLASQPGAFGGTIQELALYG